MGDLTEHFSRAEFACRGRNCCSGTAAIDFRLTAGLESLRDLLEQWQIERGHLNPDCLSIHVNSGFRCLTHNREVGSEPISQHCLGYAADVRIPSGITVDEFAELAERVPDFAHGGIGKYDWGLHLDVRREWARWDNRT